MRKVLIITYYWPPSGGAGVQRWLRFVKNLRSHGWEPVIYTAKNAKYPVFDEKLLSEIPEGVEVLSTEVPEPNNFVSKLLFWRKDRDKVLYKNQQQAGGSKGKRMKKVLWWIRGNFFIPDARFLWIKPSVKFLVAETKGADIDAIVSTGPPHSLHIIGQRVSEKLDIPWVADFRDPWVTMDYLRAVKLMKFAENKHKRLEKSVVTGADKVVVVGNVMYEEFKENYQVESSLIHNGFNRSTTEVKVALDEKFSIVHVGSFLPNRNCDDLWYVLQKMTQSNEKFRASLEIKLIGNVSPNVLESIERFDLSNYLNKINYVPYEQTKDFLGAAQLLLLPIDRIDNAKFVITGKLFEYLNAKRPIFMLGPEDGDAAAIIKDCNAGVCCNFDANEDIEIALHEKFELYLNQQNTIDSRNVDRYSSESLTEKMASILNEVVERIN